MNSLSRSLSSALRTNCSATILTSVTSSWGFGAGKAGVALWFSEQPSSAECSDAGLSTSRARCASLILRASPSILVLAAANFVCTAGGMLFCVAHARMRARCCCMLASSLARRCSTAPARSVPATAFACCRHLPSSRRSASTARSALSICCCCWDGGCARCCGCCGFVLAAAFVGMAAADRQANVLSRTTRVREFDTVARKAAKLLEA
mmetsp:Transcript_61530/g.172148  ORF Transcript_61530/g.172148 Transcript_61530/m.172148 type:complete len:208 (-) Transcript_61530:8-631(-)